MTANAFFAVTATITNVVDYTLSNANVTTNWSNITVSSANTLPITSPILFSAIEADDDVQVPYDTSLTSPNPSTVQYGPNISAAGYDLTPGERWDDAVYVPGFNEHLIDPAVTNQRIGIWRVNISNHIITLTFVQSINYYNTLYVRNGFTYGGTNIYFDPIVKAGKNIPNYSIVPQQIRTTYTTFDGNGTRFYDHRDTYVVPEQGLSLIHI